MPEVLKLLQCSNLGGMEQSAYRLMPLLGRMGYGFRVVTPRPFGPGEGYLRAVDPGALAFPYRGKFGWRSYGPFSNAVRERAAGASHVWLTGTDVTCLRAMRKLGQVKLMGHHYHHHESRAALLRWWGLYNGLCRQLHAITYPTDFTRNEALRIAPWLRDRAHVVRYAFETVYTDEPGRAARQAAARQALGLPPDAFITGNAGWLIQRKRFDIFLHTARLLTDSLGARAYFVICGSGPQEPDLRRLARTLGIAGRVRFAGWQASLDPWFDAMDVLLFNSDFDACPLTPCEAAARGTNVVASLRYGGLGESLRDGVDGFLAGDHDPSALAANIHRLQREPGLALAMRTSFAQRLRDLQGWQRALDFYSSFFGAAP